MKELSVDEFIENEDAVAVDVRSPVEFEEGSIPNARNVPLFSNDERSEIGTLYKQKGKEAAKWRAMEIVAPKLPDILGEIRSIQETGREPVIYCWRGGNRSQSVAAFADLSGLSVSRIVGGYRAYRERILELTEKVMPKKAIVLHGMTGVGKTLILNEMKAKGYPVLDLEAYAKHRGSVFGSFGEEKPSNQKTFDALLFDDLLSIRNSEYFIMEAESKRVGRATQPDFLLERKEEGIHISVAASIEKRIERTFDEYVTPYRDQEWFKDKIWESIHKIEKRIKNPETLDAIYRAIESEDYKTFIKILFEEYYDPRYSHMENSYKGEFFHVNADSLPEAVSAIESIISRSGYRKPGEQVAM
ncbi:tRNA 2-selenouridine(34) synthase MnmH [Peribacillus sp. SCS-155]|uniref:tRNA 2-selenouridine(34) synthase MnmH n=1 Tax=Peribacillus sedimenti TaxID=3115297 RepID=UPI003905AED7